MKNSLTSFMLTLLIAAGCYAQEIYSGTPEIQITKSFESQ